MRRFFNWFSNLKVAYKLMLISIFFMMPDSYMLYIFITGINANIEFAQLEKEGNEYQRPLEQLLELAPKYAGLARSTSADAYSAAALADARSRIDAAFDSLDGVNARLGAVLQFTDQGLASRGRANCTVAAARRQWNDIKSCTDVSSLNDRTTRLVASLRTMIVHVGDMSNLILDPDLDSYYLMDATLIALPQTQDRLTSVIADGTAILGTQNGVDSPSAATETPRMRAAVHAAMLQEADLDRINGSIHTALNEDPNFHGVSPTFQERIPPVLQQYNTAAQHFIALTNALSDSQPGNLTTAEYAAAGHAARDAAFHLWDVADDELDTLLQARINDYTHRKNISFGVAAAAFCAAVTLVTFITRSISGPLTRQANQLRTANAELEASRKSLEERVQSRTRELQSEIEERQNAQKRLESARRQLMESGKTPGEAEAASIVLHNVGDVLNQVNVATDFMTNNLRQSELSSLASLTQMIVLHKSELGTFMTNDKRGKLIPYLISDVTECLQHEQTALLNELETLAKGVHDITAIVAAQQTLVAQREQRAASAAS